MFEGRNESQIALLTNICCYILDENNGFSEGEIKGMLYDAIDMMN